MKVVKVNTARARDMDYVTLFVLHERCILFDKCIQCGKKITLLDKFKRLFYVPIFCDMSFVYKYTCSSKCWESCLHRFINIHAPGAEKC